MTSVAAILLCSFLQADPGKGPSAKDLLDKVERKAADRGTFSLQGRCSARKGKRDLNVKVSAEFKGGDCFTMKGNGGLGDGTIKWEITCEQGDMSSCTELSQENNEGFEV